MTCKSKDSLSFAGEVNIEKAVLSSKSNGKSFNINNQILSLEVYEDLFSPFRTINVVMKESVDYINQLPFMGEEFIDLRLDVPSLKKPIEGKFYVYRFSDRTKSKDKEIMYTIKGISIEYLADVNTKISQTFTGEGGSIAKKLMTDIGLKSKKKLIIDPTSNHIAFTAGYWCPVKAIHHLAKKVQSQSKSQTFMFYENRDGFNFRCVNDLLTGPVYQTFRKKNSTRSPDDETSLSATRDHNDEYHEILEMNVPDVGDYMDQIQSGHLASQQIVYDQSTQTYKTKDFDAKKDSKENKMNANSGYTKTSIASAPSNHSAIDKPYSIYESVADNTGSSGIQERKAFFQNLNKFKLIIMVHGRTDYTVGQIVDVDIPKTAQTECDDSKNQDKMLSGKYLVSAIGHFMTRTGYICAMELIKNSWG